MWFLAPIAHFCCLCNVWIIRAFSHTSVAERKLGSPFWPTPLSDNYGELKWWLWLDWLKWTGCFVSVRLISRDSASVGASSGFYSQERHKVAFVTTERRTHQTDSAWDSHGAVYQPYSHFHSSWCLLVVLAATFLCCEVGRLRDRFRKLNIGIWKMSI